MRSRNPVFSRRGFSRDNGYAGFNTAPQAGGPAVGTQANPYAGATRTRRTRTPSRTSSRVHRRRPRPPPAG